MELSAQDSHFSKKNTIRNKMWQPEMEGQMPVVEDDIEEIEDISDNNDNVRYYNPKEGGLQQMQMKQGAAGH
jgi:hypothetical protein